MASFFGNKCTNLKFWGENSYPVLSYPLTPLDCLQGASTKCSTECSAVPVTVFLQQALVCVVQLLLLVSVWFVAFFLPPSFLSFQSSHLASLSFCLFVFRCVSSCFILVSVSSCVCSCVPHLFPRPSLSLGYMVSRC